MHTKANRFKALTLAIIVAVWGNTAWAAPADDLKEAQRLYQQGRFAPALDKVESVIKAQPKDAQARFLKGLIFAEQKKPAEAIQVFTSLTEDYPELPEPYNNLAVLYASQGNLDKAKSALELAIHTHPAYATAHENLGDIYGQLASRAYDRALQLDKTNAGAQSKLSLLRELFTNNRGATIPKAEPAKTGKAPVATGQIATAPVVTPPAPASAAPTPAAATQAPAPAASTPPAKTSPASTPSVATVTPVPSAPTPAAGTPPPPKPTPTPTVATATPVTPAPAAATPSAAKPNEEIASMVSSWAQAWSARDVPAYLSFYAPDFQPSDGTDRNTWEKQRQERIERAKSIDVQVSLQSIEVRGNEATATFRQRYRSDLVKSDNTKTLKLIRAQDRWLIKQERTG